MDTWKEQVEKALRKLNYKMIRNNRLEAFWSVGFYGWLWVNIMRRRPAIDIAYEEAMNIEQRIMRIQKRYWRYWSDESRISA